MDTFRPLHPDQAAHYTWWRQWGGAHERNIGWRIDYILASSSRRAFRDFWKSVKPHQIGQTSGISLIATRGDAIRHYMISWRLRWQFDMNHKGGDFKGSMQHFT